MTAFKKWPWFVCCALVALVALALLGNSYLKIEERHAGFEFAESVTTEPTERMAEHVYLILVDGLRADTLDRMPYTKSLADQGSAGIFTVPGPTFSRPAYARIITGACSSINGISANNQEKQLFAPTLFDLAHGEGLKTGVSAYRWYYDLFYGPPYRTGEEDENRLVCDRPPLQYGYYYDDFGGNYDDEEIFDYGIEALVEENPNLLLVHTMDVDEMGHRHGGVSSEYLEAALLNDRCIEEFVGKIPVPEESVIIITGDHGHIDSGGHGGLEKEAAEIKVAFYGKGVAAAGEIPEGYSQLDLAPTIAALLGLPFTSYMEGRIVSEAFDWPAETVAAKEALLDEAHRPLLLELGRRFRVDPTANEDGRAVERLAQAVNRRWIALRAASALAVILAAFFLGIRLRRRSASAEEAGKRKRSLY
ncbi:MAG: sulfatase-like hydrolase/transferase, partial [Firmicutes bacterium]|nr:sulfatase-like hydrolase/transferase [Bacillota bacterium]